MKNQKMNQLGLKSRDNSKSNLFAENANTYHSNCVWGK